MACLGVRYGLTAAFLDDRSDWISASNRLHSLSIHNIPVKNCFPRTCVADTIVSDRPVSNQASCSINTNLVLAERIKDKYYHECNIEISNKLDEWILGSVTEIVKNIRQAPLLVQIYANGKIRMEKSVKPKSWPTVVTERSASSSLEGIILVEELGENGTSREFNEEGETRAFGILIQGKIKGKDHCKSACYLLKTSSVNGGGLGFICSHYCLMKVKSFTESASSQFISCWLVK